MRYRLFLLYLLFIILLLLEGTIFQVFLPMIFNNSFIVIPHIFFITFIFFAYYYGEYFGSLNGLTFGLLTDISFGHVLGVHAFVLTIIGYVMGKMQRFFHLSFTLFLSIVMIFEFIYDLFIYFLYALFNITSISAEYALFYQIIPSIFINLLYAIIFYLPLNKLLNFLEKSEAD